MPQKGSWNIEQTVVYLTVLNCPVDPVSVKNEEKRQAYGQSPLCNRPTDLVQAATRTA